jgi:hypothetical protein
MRPAWLGLVGWLAMIILPLVAIALALVWLDR